MLLDEKEGDQFLCLVSSLKAALARTCTEEDRLLRVYVFSLCNHSENGNASLSIVAETLSAPGRSDTTKNYVLNNFFFYVGARKKERRVM